MDKSVRRGVGIIAVVVVAIAAILFIPKQEQKKPIPPNNDPWRLVSYDANDEFGTYLGNGFISTRIMSDGVGSQIMYSDDGKAQTTTLGCFMEGVYENEKLAPIPTWSDLRIYDGQDRFVIDKRAAYKQVLDMRTGILTTNATWRAGKKKLEGSITIIVSRARPNVGWVRAVLTPDFDGEVELRYPVRMPDGNSVKGNVYRVGSSGTVISICRSLWVKTGLASGSHTLPARNISRIAVKQNETTTMELYSALYKGKDSDAVAKKASDEVKRVSGWDNSKPREAAKRFVEEHRAAWAALWSKHITIDGPRKDQQALNSCMFYLLQSVREDSQWSIPPMGLSSDSFSGHVFWDADIWMFPALLLQHPELARSIVDYRYNTLSGALANAKLSGYAGAEYAWESGETGAEDTPPGLVYRNERHINGDIALAQWQYYLATGDLSWLKTRGFAVIKATADYWVSRATLTNDRYEILQVVPPDENAELVDNSVYTNAIAKMNLEIALRAAKLTGQAANPKWATVAAKLYIPFDSKANRFIAHDNDKAQMAKQADTELLAYPLQFTLPGQDMAAVYRNTLGFYVPKVGKRGPAMTHSAYSIIEARLGNCDTAYTHFKRCYRPYLRGPFNYFNETPSEILNHFCFLTGCAGPIQAALYGFAGIQMDYFPSDPTSPALKYNPCLPKEWKSIRITGVQWRGETFDINIEGQNKFTIEK